jgi:hypothetical protein
MEHVSPQRAQQFVLPRIAGSPKPFLLRILQAANHLIMVADHLINIAARFAQILAWFSQRMTPCR